MIRPGSLLPLSLAVAFLAPLAAARAAAEPAAGASADPPWSAEAPGAAGSAFGLGLDAPWEEQKSLTIDSVRTTVTTRDLARGISSTQVMDGDPALLNRKFTIGWRQSAIGVQVPIALPRLSLGTGLAITPTLVFQAAGTDFDIDFHDRPEPADSTSLHGGGLALGAALDLVAPLCRRCRWYAGAGYRYRLLPRTAVDRGEPIAEPGAAVLASDVRLSRSIGEATFRLGHVLRGDRAAFYLGLVRRQTRTTVDDLVRLAQDSIHLETDLASRTRFASATTAALAGLDVRLRDSLFLRAEVTFGDGDHAALGKLVILPPWKPWPVVTWRETREDETLRQAREIAKAINVAWRQIRDRFAARSEGLLRQPPSQPAWCRLFGDTERDLLDTLRANGSGGSRDPAAPLRDAVTKLFATARSELGLRCRAETALLPWARAARAVPAVLLAPVPAGALIAAQPGAAPGDEGVARRVCRKILAWLDNAIDLAARDSMAVSLCIETAPRAGGYFLFKIYSDSHPHDPAFTAEGQVNNGIKLKPLIRGTYRYEFDPGEPYRRKTDEIDLVADYRALIECTLVDKTSSAAPVCQASAGKIEEACPR